MSRILITGMTGYIGSHLAIDQLRKGNQLFAVVREGYHETYLSDELRAGVQFVTYDGTSESMAMLMQEIQPELVYHLATYYNSGHSIEISRKLLESNLALGMYLLEAMTLCGCKKLIYATTVTTHQNGDKYQPVSLYAATKQAFSDLVGYYTSTDQLKSVGLVLSDTYGPGDQRPKVLNLVMDAIESQIPLDLTLGTQNFDAVYIDDVVSAFEIAADLIDSAPSSHSLYQLPSHTKHTLRETIELFQKVNGVSLIANWGGRAEPSHPMRNHVQAYPSLPKWFPKTSLQDGLRKCWGNRRIKE